MSLAEWQINAANLQSQAVAEAQQADGATSTKKLWGGRFTGATDPLMEKFNESLLFDKRMWQEDIRVCAAPSFLYQKPMHGHSEPALIEQEPSATLAVIP